MESPLRRLLRHWRAWRAFTAQVKPTIRLLEVRIDGAPLAERMVAAYVMGFRFPMAKRAALLSTP